MEESAARYGTIGIAFTYLAWLYVVALLFLATAILGQVIAEDQGRLGQFIRRTRSTPRIEQSAESGGPTAPTGLGKSAEPESTASS